MRLTPDKRYRLRLMLPCLAILFIFPGIYVLGSVFIPDIFLGENMTAILLYFGLWYILPLLTMPLVIYAVAKKKKLIRMLIFIGFNIGIGLTRYAIKIGTGTHQEFHLLIAFLINIYGWIKLERTGKLFK